MRDTGEGCNFRKQSSIYRFPFPSVPHIKIIKDFMTPGMAQGEHHYGVHYDLKETRIWDLEGKCPEMTLYNGEHVLKIVPILSEKNIRWEA